MGYWVHGHSANGLPLNPIYSEASTHELAQAEAERGGMVVDRVEAGDGEGLIPRAISRTNPVAHKAPFSLARSLAFLFRVFAVLVILWTVIELLVLVVGSGAASSRFGPEVGLASVWQALWILARGVWLSALSLAVAEGLTLLLTIEGRINRPASEGQMHDRGSANEMDEPFWQTKRRNLDLS
jgi:hypothetical protein